MGGGITLIGFLILFKYAGFFVNSVRYVAGMDSVTIDIILPLGISFYTFSALSYLIDIYRGDYHAERNILYVILFIVFFPKLTAGPIVRGRDFFKQVRNYRGIEKASLLEGVQIFSFGLFKKIVLADHLGVFVDDVFYAPNAYDTFTVVLGVISYSLQIYFDFSGYSDMAIGISKALGFDFKPNFNLPYMASGMSDFWRRWHISLSSWFKDYVYIPLGGNRKGVARTYLNIIIVMLLSGLWHGAGWTFIAWGALHAVASCLEKLLKKYLDGLGAVVNIVLTFVVVTLLWVQFRADSFSKAIDVWKGVFTIHDGINQPYTWSFLAIAVIIVASVIAWLHSKRMANLQSDNSYFMINGFYPILNLSKFWHLVVFITFCGLTVIMGYFGNTAFIYGQF